MRRALPRTPYGWSRLRLSPAAMLRNLRLCLVLGNTMLSYVAHEMATLGIAQQKELSVCRKRCRAPKRSGRACWA